jgi:hydrogenase maturation factor
MNLLQEWIKRILAMSYISEVKADDYVLAHFRLALCKVDEEGVAHLLAAEEMHQLAELGLPRV